MRPPVQGLVHRRGDHVEMLLQRRNARVDCVLISASLRDRKLGDHERHAAVIDPEIESPRHSGPPELHKRNLDGTLCMGK
jgi:hypothetical protein